MKLKVLPYVIDISDKDINISDFLFSDVLIIAITSKNSSDIKSLIKKVEKSEVRKVLFVSSTSVYPYTNGIVTEETDTKNSPLADIEKLFKRIHQNNKVYNSAYQNFSERKFFLPLNHN